MLVFTTRWPNCGAGGQRGAGPGQGGSTAAGRHGRGKAGWRHNHREASAAAGLMPQQQQRPQQVGAQVSLPPAFLPSPAAASHFASCNGHPCCHTTPPSPTNTHTHHTTTTATTTATHLRLQLAGLVVVALLLVALHALRLRLRHQLRGDLQQQSRRQQQTGKGCPHTTHTDKTAPQTGMPIVARLPGPDSHQAAACQPADSPASCPAPPCTRTLHTALHSTHPPHALRPPGQCPWLGCRLPGGCWTWRPPAAPSPRPPEP